MSGNWRAKMFTIKLSRKQAAKVSERWEFVGCVLDADNYNIEIEKEEWVVS